MAVERIETGYPRMTGRSMFVVALVAALVGVTVLVGNTRATRHPSRPPTAPHVPAGAISTLDAVSPMPANTRPKSAQAVGGMLFVRCTHLWAALPDGSQAHLLLSKAGLASPTFSPDARTIAFLATGEAGPEIWMASADGSRMAEVGALSSSGSPVGAQARWLQWSPNGEMLVFTLVSPGDDPSTIGSSTWELDVDSGSLARVATGVTQASWVDQRLVGVSGLYGTTDFMTLGIRRGNSDGEMAKRISSGSDDLSVGVPPLSWYGVGSETAATVVRAPDGSLVLTLRKDPWNGKPYATEKPPATERIDPSSRPAVSGDGTFVGIGLIGSDGGPDLGMFDTLTSRWTVKDYAWDPVFSTATPALATTYLWRASNVARAFLESWPGTRSDARLFLDSPVRHADLAFTAMGSAMGTPHKTATGWSVPATVYGLHGSGYAYRKVDIAVAPQAGRMVVNVTRASGLRQIRSIPDAVRFLRNTLTVKVAAPRGLPANATLAPRPVNAWSWNTRITGFLKIKMPFGGNGKQLVTFGYDDGGFGCGASSVPTDVAGKPGDAVKNVAIAQGSTPEVIWPADPGASSAPFSIAGNLPRRVLLKIADAPEAARRSSPDPAPGRGDPVSPPTG